MTPRDAGSLPGLLPGLVLIGAILFNPMLAVVNGHVAPLTPAAVILCEIALVGAAHLLIIRHWRPAMEPWYALAGVLVLIAALRSAAMGGLEIKALRDVLLLPSFVLLGMAAGPRRLVPVLLAIHTLVLAVMALEWLNVDTYSELFRIKDYYINTRGYLAEEFTNAQSQLYISADRPEERVFSFVQIHRLSSLFLEPVSLGNYCIIITALLCAWWRRLGWATLGFLALGNVAVLIGSDGRLAVMSNIMIIALSLIATHLPRRSAVLYLPLVIGGGVVLVALLGLRAGTDDFQGRIAYTAELLARLRIDDIMGVSAELVVIAADSGVAYMMITQSIFGLCILWWAIVYLADDETRPAIIYTHAVCLYLALSMLISYAFLSIKTASLLWFLFGALQAAPGVSARVVAPARPMRQIASSAAR